MPETANDTPPTNSTNKVHVHKSESTKATQVKQSKQTEEPVVPKIKWNTDSIELNGKVHKLPITKDYILKEYNDVFKGVGTLPGGPYHIRLKEQYRLVQHPPRFSSSSHAISIQSRVEQTGKRRHNHRSQGTH